MFAFRQEDTTMKRTASIAIAMLLAAGPAAAAEHPLSGWLEDNGITGTWDGRRLAWTDEGLSVYGGFVGEAARNVHGGQAVGSGFASQTNLGVHADLDRLFDGPPLTVTIEATNRAGRNVSRDFVGNLIDVQEIWGGGSITRLSELSIRAPLGATGVEVKAGRIFAGSEFATLPAFCDYMSNAVCGNPASLGANSGMSFYPVATWGVRLQADLGDGVLVRTGSFEVNPSMDERNGLEWSRRGRTGWFYPLELEYSRDEGAQHPTQYRIGGYYDTSHTADWRRDDAGGSAVLSGDPFRVRHGRYGAWAMAEQDVYRDRDDPSRGLMAWFAATTSDRATAYFESFVEGGLEYAGPLPGRRADTIGVLIARGRVSDERAAAQRDVDLLQPGSVAVQHAETVFEINYAMQLTPWLRLRPNVQYVARPGATDALPDAWVLGLQTAVAF
jgi:porin